jgi:hypothetical protein
MEELSGILGLSAEDNLKLQCSTQNSQMTVVESRGAHCPPGDKGRLSRSRRLRVA